MNTNTKKKLACYSFIMLIAKCFGDEYFNADNINMYIFDSQHFTFIDLTLSLNKQYASLSDDEKAQVRIREGYNIVRNNGGGFCEKEWFGTTIDLNYRYNNPSVELQSVKNEIYSSKQPNVNAIPLGNLIVPLMVVDISNKVHGEANFILKKHHLDFFLNNYFGNTAQPCIIVFKFGWSAHKYNIRRYYGLFGGKNDTSGIPGISEEVAKWIKSAYKNVIGVGVDLPSVDPAETFYAAHNTLIEAGLYVVTNVDLVQYIPDAWCTALLLPQAGQGSLAPVRFVAICPKSKMEKHVDPLHRL